MSPMQIVIPMSGTGQRFLSAGYRDPKPLIRIDGAPILEYVCALFPGEKNISFVCNETHLRETEMRSEIARIAPTGKVFSIAPHKKGPVFAVAQIFPHIADDEPVLVSYCDFFAILDYAKFCQEMEKEGFDGAVPAYTGFHPHLLHGNLYAGMRANDQGEMLEIQEKYCFTDNPEDCWHSAGLYYFKSGKLLKHFLQKFLDEGESINGEYYMSMVYDFMQKDGLRISVFPMEYFCQWGTPEDLREYQNWAETFHYLSSK